MKVAVIMGSKSDYPKLEEGIKLLERFGVEVVTLDRVLAHRTPKQLVAFLEEIENDTDVIIGAAGQSSTFTRGYCFSYINTSSRITNKIINNGWFRFTFINSSNATRYTCSNSNNRFRYKCSINGTSNYRD